MKRAKALLIARSLRPRVVHALPGRLRLAMPLLKRVPPERRPIAELLRPLFFIMPGVEAVEPSFETGKVLVRYDTGRLDEARLLAWVQLLAKLVARHWERLGDVPLERIPELVPRLEKELAPYTRAPARAENAEIPEHVWL